MEINGFIRYNLYFTHDGGYLDTNGEKNTPFHCSWTKDCIDGGEVMKIIACWLNKPNCLGYKVGEENIEFDLIDTHSGSCEYLRIHIKEVHG